MKARKMDYDVVLMGAGPAGLAAVSVYNEY